MKVAEGTAELRRASTELEMILDASLVGIALFRRTRPSSAATQRRSFAERLRILRQCLWSALTR
jgi:hypothetical protein